MVFNTATISRVSDGMMASLTTVTKRDSQTVCQNTETSLCSCPSGFEKKDCSISSEDFLIYKEIRLGLMNDFVQTLEARNEYELMNEYYLTLQIFGIDALIGKFELMKRITNLKLRGQFIGEKDLRIDNLLGKISANKKSRQEYVSLITSIILPSQMPNYLNTEKSNREAISFIAFSSSIDKFGITNNIGKNEIMRESVTVSSSKYLRSNILIFEISESTKYVVSPIQYNTTTYSIKNYATNSLMYTNTSTKSGSNVVKIL